MSRERTIPVTEPMECERAFDGDSDWYSLRTARGLFLPGASIEGTASEMRALANAIRTRGGYSATRCAAWVKDNQVVLYSPRNSTFSIAVPLARAEELAAQIERDVLLPVERVVAEYAERASAALPPTRAEQLEHAARALVGAEAVLAEHREHIPRGGYDQLADWAMRERELERAREASLRALAALITPPTAAVAAATPGEPSR
jgi:hypothetical protein